MPDVIATLKFTIFFHDTDSNVLYHLFEPPVKGQALDGRRPCGLGRLGVWLDSTVPGRRGTGKLPIVRVSAEVGSPDDRARKSEVVVRGVIC